MVAHHVTAPSLYRPRVVPTVTREGFGKAKQFDQQQTTSVTTVTPEGLGNVFLFYSSLSLSFQASERPHILIHKEELLHGLIF